MDNKKKVASILMTLTVGGVSGHYIDDLIEKYNLQTDRYPMNIEYKIIEKCISNYSEPIKQEILKNKREVCICALEKTELEYPYKIFIDNKDKFLNIFEMNAIECILR